MSREHRARVSTLHVHGTVSAPPGHLVPIVRNWAWEATGGPTALSSPLLVTRRLSHPHPSPKRLSPPSAFFVVAENLKGFELATHLLQGPGPP